MIIHGHPSSSGHWGHRLHTNPGYHTLCGEKFLLDTFEDNQMSRPGPESSNWKKPQDRRRHIVLCVFIIVAIVRGSEGYRARPDMF